MKRIARVLGVLVAAAAMSACEEDFLAPQPFADVTAAPSDTTVLVGATFQQRCTISGATGDAAVLVYSTSNSGVAEVTSTGMITAKASGTARITCRQAISGGDSASTNVTVQGTGSASITLADFSVARGSTVTLSPVYRDANGSVQSCTFAYGSANNSIASVNSAGVVTGVEVGSTDITASCNGVSRTARATVTAVSSGFTIVLTPATSTVAVGSTQQISAACANNGASMTCPALNWGSSNNAVATVNSSGLVTGVSASTAAVSITACGTNAGTTACSPPVSVTVTSSPSGFIITLAPSSVTLAAGGTRQMTPTCTNNGASATCPTLAWGSSNNAVATVNSSGLVTAASGATNGQTTNITACGNNVCSAAVTVTIGTTSGSNPLIWTEENGQVLYVSAAGYTLRNETIDQSVGIRGTLFGGWLANHSAIGLQYSASRNAWALDIRNSGVDLAVRSKAGDGKCYRFSPVQNNGTYYKIQEHINAFGYPAGEPGTFVSTMSGGATAPPLPAFKVQLSNNVLQFVSITPSGTTTQPSCE